jgi:hypothetical protein
MYVLVRVNVFMVREGNARSPPTVRVCRLGDLPHLTRFHPNRPKDEVRARGLDSFRPG